MFMFLTSTGRQISLGPDAAHMWLMVEGKPTPRPFYLRWLLPWACRNVMWRWWAIWAVSWPLIALGAGWWRLTAGDELYQAVLVAGLIIGLPGVLGPNVVIPVGVDLPTTALNLLGVAALEHGWWPLAVALFTVAGMIKESAPIWPALWVMSPVPLIALVAPAVRAIVARPGPSPFGPMFQEIADHPIRTAWPRHLPHARDAWWFVAPFGVTLVGLYDAPWQLIVVLVVAHLQLLGATDHVRLVAHAAGPAMAVAASTHIGAEWVVVALVAHFFWWRTPQRG